MHFYCFIILIVITKVYSRNIDPVLLPSSSFDENNGDHWNLQAQWMLNNKVNSPLKKGVAKNVIFFLGDGMSIPTLAATRAYMGQKFGFTGEEVELSFERFPYTGLSKTYCVNSNVADSACSGTAYLSGVKANAGTVGVTGAVKRGNCKAQLTGKYSVTGLMDWAQKAGKSTGIVTTTRVTHASPASAYAHSADRVWESDSILPNHAKLCPDIAKQLVMGDVGSKFNVIFGGGRDHFYPVAYDDDTSYNGSRTDHLDLVFEWTERQKNRKKRPKFFTNRKELMSHHFEENEVALGLFSGDHMPYHLDADPNEMPTLGEMTERAIHLLSKNSMGFVLFVEGGRIDMAHHFSRARKALDETAELSKAVEIALRQIDLEETLIIVTSDHSHTMSYNGYSPRGSDILGLTKKFNATDDIPYTILSYANGPGFKNTTNDIRHDISLDDLSSKDYSYPSLTPMPRETHGGDDVAVYAIGPWAHLFTGNYEQNYIPHAIAYASCIGNGLTLCT